MPLILNILSTKSSFWLIGVVSMAASFNLRMTQASYAQEVNQNLVCQRFPLNFRCVGYTPKPQQEKSSREKQQKPLFEREANQIVKVRLELSGPDNEWIWIETNNNGTGANILTAYHTKRVRRELLSNLSTIALRVGAEQLASEVIDGYDGPVPIPNVSFYRWADLRSGLLTIEYAEEELIRTITFRVPSENL